MIVLGVLILVVCGVIVVSTLARGDEPTRVDLGWVEINSSVAGVFIAGALTLLLGVVGILVLLAGLRRSRRRRADIKELKARADAASKSRPDENDPGTGTTGSAQTRHDHPPRDADESFDTAPRDRT